jgi:hypothetical protein
MGGQLAGTHNCLCKDRYRARQTPAESRGIFLVPITMVAIKAKSP